MNIFYYGCWNDQPGHHLWKPEGSWVSRRHTNSVVYYGPDDCNHIDANLAPRRRSDGGLCYVGQGLTAAQMFKIKSDSVELDQGLFLHHHLSNGYSALQWWDYCQGDDRPGSNSTILLAGKHSSEECLNRLKEEFPTVISNLQKRNISLLEIKLKS